MYSSLLYLINHPVLKIIAKCKHTHFINKMQPEIEFLKYFPLQILLRPAGSVKVEDRVERARMSVEEIFVVYQTEKFQVECIVSLTVHRPVGIT